jgi:hypothetical protein
MSSQVYRSVVYLFFSVYMINMLVYSSLSYYCKQYIAKFTIKTRVVVYKLVKQLRLIVMVDLGY